MTDTSGTSRGTGADQRSAPVHEAYSFACMSCGHGWEQSYDIAHRTDEHGRTSCVYYTGSQPVPSPLTRPTCVNCGGHLVRILRSGLVASASWEHLGHATRAVSPARTAARHRSTGALPLPEPVVDRDDAAPDRGVVRRHHWFAGVLGLFHRRSDGDGRGEGAGRAA